MREFLDKIKNNAIEYCNADEKTKNNEIIALYALTHCKNGKEFNQILQSIPEKIRNDKSFNEMVEYERTKFEQAKIGTLDDKIKSAQDKKEQKRNSNGKDDSFERN